MNGTLCYRNEEPVQGVRANLFVRMKYYYQRHGVQNFIRKLSESGHFCVCIYTSMMVHNAKAGLNAILGAEIDLIEHVFDHDCNSKDEHGENDWDTIRDLKKVWAKMDNAFDYTNTLVLDNEARKFRNTPDNGIVVPEFGVKEVKARDTSTLSELQEYLLEMGKATKIDASFDVREYLKSRPFGKTVKEVAVDEVAKLSISVESLSVTENKIESSENDQQFMQVTENESKDEEKKISCLDDETIHVHLVCIDGFKAVMNDSKSKLVVYVKLREDVRIERKMSLKLLAEAVGRENVEVVPIDSRVEGSTNNSIAVTCTA